MLIYPDFSSVTASMISHQKKKIIQCHMLADFATRTNAAWETHFCGQAKSNATNYSQAFEI